MLTVPAIRIYSSSKDKKKRNNNSSNNDHVVLTWKHYYPLNNNYQENFETTENNFSYKYFIAINWWGQFNPTTVNTAILLVIHQSNIHISI